MGGALRRLGEAAGNSTHLLGRARLLHGQRSMWLSLGHAWVGGTVEPSGTESPSGSRKPGHMTSKHWQLGLSAECGHSGHCFCSDGGLMSFPEHPLQAQPHLWAPQCQQGRCLAS